MAKYRIPKTPEEFSRRLTDLHDEKRDSREQNRGKTTKNWTLEVRVKVLQKTDSRCHLCGDRLEEGNVAIDHVLPRSSGGSDSIENLLPACKLCNTYKLDASPERFQWILKVGVLSLREIENGRKSKPTKLGIQIASKFLAKETYNKKRRDKRS